MSKWYIRHFGDYHEIESPTMKTLELGCFVPKGDPHGCCRYFGLFYKGKRPPRREVIARLLTRVEHGPTFHYYTGDEITSTEEQIRSEVPRW